MKASGSFLRLALVIAAVPLSRCSCDPKLLAEGVPQIDVCSGSVCYQDLKKQDPGGPAPEVDVDFGTITQGGTASATITVKNTGTFDLHVFTPRNEDLAGSRAVRFSQADRAKMETAVFLTIAPDKSATVTMELRGTACGDQEATWRLFSDDNVDIGSPYVENFPGADNPIVIKLRGHISGPCLCPLPPGFLDFGAVALGQAPIKRFSFESCGDQNLVIPSGGATIAEDVSGVYAVANTVFPNGGSMAPGEVGHVDVRYTPAFESPEGDIDPGELRIANNAPTSSPYYPVALSGRGTPRPSCKLRFMPVVSSFGIVSSSSTRSFRLWNDGEINCVVTDISRTEGSADFAVSGGGTPPSFSLAPDESRDVLVTYTPNDSSSDEATFTATGNDIDSYTSMAQLFVSGNPTPPSEGCVLNIQPDFGDFGSVTVGESVEVTFSLQNVGEGDLFGANCNIQDISLPVGAPDYSISSNLSFFSMLLIPDGPSTSLTVKLEPLSKGVKTGVLRFMTNDVVQPVRDIPLWGNGLGAELCVTLGGTQPATNQMCGATQPCATLNYGTGTATRSETVTLRNCGEGKLKIRGINGDPTNGLIFLRTAPLSNAMPIELTPNATTPFTIQYDPTGNPGDFGGFEVLSNAESAPAARIATRGNYTGSCPRILRCFPDPTLDFGTQDVGTSNTRSVICANYGSEEITVANVSLSGSNNLTLGTGTYSTLSPGETFMSQVTCTPTSAGLKAATLSIASNACDRTPYEVDIECTGIVPDLPPCTGSDTFEPLEKWRWTGTPDFPQYDDVWTTPIVVQLTDDNADGSVDALDTPDVVFTALKSTMEAMSSGEDASDFSKANDPQPAVMVAVSGNNGNELWTYGVLPAFDGDPAARAFESEASIAAADIDADGLVEIIGLKYTYVPPRDCPEDDFDCQLKGKFTYGSLIALENDGTFKWESARFHFTDEFMENASAPALGDMNGDGFPEIAVGNAVFDHNGLLLFEGITPAQGVDGHGEGGAGHGALSVFADLNGDGMNELVAGTTAFRYDGTILWDRKEIGEFNLGNIYWRGDGVPAVGNFDADTSPEIMLLDGKNDLTILEHDGSTKFGPVHIVSGNTDENGQAKGFITTAAALGDLDGDGFVEIVIAATNNVHVFEHDLTPKWSAPISDQTGASGPTTFDFEGDGRAEVVHADENNVFVWDGVDGSLKYTATRGSRTIMDNPVIADVDGDDEAEIILAMESPNPVLGTMYGVIVYSNKSHGWVSTTKIWNQHSYHITNVTESGIVPAFEGQGWIDHNVYRSNEVRCE